MISDSVDRLLVCGSRCGWCDWLVDRHVRRLQPRLVIHGAQRGVDMLADRIARRLRVPVLPFPADWDHLGDSAGDERNARMLREGRPTHCLALPGPFSSGTWNMIRKCVDAGVPTEVYCADCGNELGTTRGACLIC